MKFLVVMVAIIILNWNGWTDTIECIKSINKVNDTDVSTIIVDNGSTNESVDRITEFIHQQNSRIIVLSEGESLINKLQNKDIVLYKLSQNYGFAKGNNLGLKLISNQDVDYFWVLNNDTVIEKDSISILKFFLDNHKEYLACTPQIRYFTPNHKIWNCGGRLFYGMRKYYYGDAENVLFKNDFFNISFVTGCALLIRPELIDTEGRLFTENFFFGEEDFEFSLRMKKERKKIACCTRSIIYHKVSASTKNKPKNATIYIHYLNRYINIRQHFSSIKFYFWRKINNVYVALLLRKQGLDKYTIEQLVRDINRDCFKYEGVSKELFESAMNKEKNNVIEKRIV